jgi:hypothetical protein
MSLRIPIGALVVSLLVTAIPAQAAWVNGKWVNMNPNFMRILTDTVYKKPASASDQTLLISDLRIQKLDMNEKGIEVGVNRYAAGKCYAYNNITIRHCEISDAYRQVGIHADFIRMFGGGSDQQNVPINVTVDDVYCHDGNSLPLIIQDGLFNNITIRDLRIEGTANGVQLVTMNSGSINNITIENCPGLNVSICGAPGTIKTCTIRNSPGAIVHDAANKNGYSGVKIINLDTKTAKK